MGNVLGGLVAGFGGGYAMGRRIRSDREADALSEGLKRAASVAPEKIEETGDYTKTMGLTGADEQARMLQEQDAAFGADGARATAEALNANAADATPASGMVKTAYRMGGKTQEAPFSPEQIQAAQFKSVGDFYAGKGMIDKAASAYGLAKARDAEAGEVAAKTYASEGLKKHGDLRGADKQWKEISLLAEGAANAGRWDLWKQYRDSGQALRGDLMKEAVNRADVLYRTTGSIAGYVDAHSKYALDGVHGAAIKKLDDGREEVSFGAGIDPVVIGKTDDPKARQISVATLRGMLTDPAKLAEYEQRAVERLIKRREDMEDALIKPVAIGKDQTLVVPLTGQTFAPGANRGFDPKEANSVLDDVRTIFRDKYGIERDPTTGMPKDPMAKSAWTDQAISKSNLAERVFMKNPGLPPAMLAEIADKGQTGMAVVEIGGKQQRVPAVTYNGRTFILGGEDAGMQIPAPSSPQSDQGKPATKGLGTRSVSGKIGMSRADDFPKVSKDEQAVRDAEAGRILVAELGSVDQARRDLAEIDAQLKNPRLDGTQRGILQGYRNRLASGIAASS